MIVVYTHFYVCLHLHVSAGNGSCGRKNRWSSRLESSRLLKEQLSDSGGTCFFSCRICWSWCVTLAPFNRQNVHFFFENRSNAEKIMKVDCSNLNRQGVHCFGLLGLISAVQTQGKASFIPHAQVANTCRHKCWHIAMRVCSKHLWTVDELCS